MRLDQLTGQVRDLLGDRAGPVIGRNSTIRRSNGSPGSGCASMPPAKRPARNRLSGVVIVQPVPEATSALID
jgi:hypothetical protein